MEKVAIQLKKLIGTTDLIVSSPYVRARQTAEILREVFPSRSIMEAPELVPHGPPQALVRWFQAHGRDCKSVIAVGHEPQLSLFASWILAGATDSIVDFKKSGVACFEVGSAADLGPSSVELKWLVQPRHWVDD